jgi:hypothetical protein
MERPTNCLLWDGAINKAGYGITWHNNKWAYAHRAVMNAKKGEVVLHICDNPRCVNPEHLKVGTHQDNSSDMVKKNRQATGENCGNAILSEPQVREIRKCKGYLSSRIVAKIYNISKTNVLDIWNRKIWKHI